MPTISDNYLFYLPLLYLITFSKVPSAVAYSLSHAENKLLLTSY